LKIDGIIGWNVIKNLDVTFDCPNALLYIQKPAENSNIENSMFWLDCPIVKMKAIDGSDLFFEFDTGAQNSNIYDALLNKLSIKEYSEKSQTFYGIGGSKRIEMKRIDNLNILLDQYCLNFKNINTGNRTEDLYLDGKIGIDLFKKIKIRISATNGIFKVVD
jgi:hypothetical protein